MFFLKNVFVVALVIVIEKPTTRTTGTGTSKIFAFFGGAAESARASLP